MPLGVPGLPFGRLGELSGSLLDAWGSPKAPKVTPEPLQKRTCNLGPPAPPCPVAVAVAVWSGRGLAGRPSSCSRKACKHKSQKPENSRKETTPAQEKLVYISYIPYIQYPIYPISNIQYSIYFNWLWSERALEAPDYETST